MASRRALAAAEVVFGGPRHLALIEHGDKRAWPVPFSTAPVLALRGRRVAVLASGDPFWHGAGGTLARALGPGEWRAYPAPSVFSLAAARLGWRLEEVCCLGLHAAPFARLRPRLYPGARVIATLRDGPAVAALADWLTGAGFDASQITVFERLGGPHERIHGFRAQDACGAAQITAPVSVAITVPQDLPKDLVVPRCSGLPDAFFAHDGQITKRPVRALALSALAPRPGELLWDIGAGSGSVGIEWLLAHPANRAIALEADPERAARARLNAAALGADRLDLRLGRAQALIATLPRPDAVFVGGGADPALFEALWSLLAPGTRLVAHAVTLETEALLSAWHGRAGGQLLRIELAEATPLGRKRGWRAAFPVVQWSVTR